MPKTLRPTSLWLGILGLSSLSLGLRFWGLGRFNQLIFDEIYYIPFALGYLNRSPVFDAHPPLGKYLIALGLWLSQGPATQGQWPTVVVAGQSVSLLSGRWLNALVGSTLPALVAALAYGLSQGQPRPRRVRFSLMAATLMTLEGLTLVESRLALINLYWLWFGVLGQVCWVWARGSLGRLATGISLGAAINGKWNGAAFGLGLLLRRWRRQGCDQPISWRRELLYVGILPTLTYGLLWLPHLAMTGESLWKLHQQLWGAHQTIGAQAIPHPYCSPWFTWPLMLRPVAYFYQAYPPEQVVTIQAMGNPMLWWWSTAAIFALGVKVCRSPGAWWGRSQPMISPVTSDSPAPRAISAPGNSSAPSTAADGGGPSSSSASALTVEAFLVVNYLTQWLPWLLVSRCTFLYHALGMVVFSALALAWLLSGWLGHRRRSHRAMAWLLLSLVALGFLFWLPLFLGWPLSPRDLHRRWWIPSWI
ncbi:phospholipid carrier-dependent glycosyltransferase [Leptolyngbya sp. BL0902]|uniref:phospholipid carrier-dependent glycosyltransferase n=1 Tax=Leptolyngbya sp. BL0902 TaxID=1115757 RepID=UPI0018E7941E|nr:phospholipid carrier-dependent glycosyltransferase [Leptolyngbya sp. BL0902]QQE66194.1 phospholipid carrier-dependent glycosyltransferase [Leptolyngbya sp. BL0902]